MSGFSYHLDPMPAHAMQYFPGAGAPPPPALMAGPFWQPLRNDFRSPWPFTYPQPMLAPYPPPPYSANSTAPQVGPPGMLASADMLLPKDLVYMRVPDGGIKLWEHRHGTGLSFKIYMALCDYTVKQLIDHMGGGKGDAVSEAIERGGGRWEQGKTFKYDSDKANITPLNKLGWTKSRGTESEPLWVVFHKA